VVKNLAPGGAAPPETVSGWAQVFKIEHLKTHQLRQQGWSYPRIAEALGIGMKTAHRWLAVGLSDDKPESFAPPETVSGAIVALLKCSQSVERQYVAGLIQVSNF